MKSRGVDSVGIKGEKGGMSGLDFAFYKNRAYYHTSFDSIPGMGRNEGRKALWALMETTRGAGLALLNDDEAHDSHDNGVYFDILGNAMVAISMSALFVTHIVFLVTGPLIIIGLMTWVLMLTSNAVEVHSQEPVTAWIRIKKVTATLMGWGRFWISLLIAIGAHAAVGVGCIKLNPYVVYSHPYIVLTTLLTLSFLALGLPISSFYWLWPSPPSSQKFAIILEIYLLSWIFLVIGTVGLNNLNLGGVYLITVWNFCAWLAAVIALVEAIVRARTGGTRARRSAMDLVGESEPSRRETSGHRFVPGVMYTTREDSREREVAEPVETEPTEITPLMQQHRRHSVGGREYVVGIDNGVVPVDGTKGLHAEYEESGWWILQMFALIPAPAVLLFQIDLILLHALRNTLADGSSPIAVYAGISALSLLVFLNIAPFAHNIHRVLYWFILVVFMVSLFATWTAFPFAQDAPLKLFFQQSVELDSHSDASLLTVNSGLVVPNAPFTTTDGVVRAVTQLHGLSGWVDEKIIPELPSASGKNVNCSVSEARKGVWSCGWESDLTPSPGGNSSSLEADARPSRHWMSLKTERLNRTAAKFTIQGVNTRSCKLYLNNPITSFEVIGSGGRLQPGYDMPDGGVSSINLWSRTWDKEFVVEVGWGGSAPGFKMEGRAACEWAEYASTTAGSRHASVSAQIPALEEILQFLPLWATVTKWSVGLVEAWTRFSV